MWKSEKAHLLELQVQQAFSQTLFELGTSGLAYSTRYIQYSLITKIKIDRFHPKPWFPKTHLIYTQRSQPTFFKFLQNIG